MRADQSVPPFTSSIISPTLDLPFANQAIEALQAYRQMVDPTFNMPFYRPTQHNGPTRPPVAVHYQTNLAQRPQDQARLPPQVEQEPILEPHRVHVVHCAGCSTFLSDRVMRAVLLLRPHITLYSTDAMPANIGSLDSDQDADEVERTCQCLTQSFGCLHCGLTVGYNICSPCDRCTTTVSKSQRSANGHRWVFHYSSVVSTERRYREGEEGVLKSHYETFLRSNPGPLSASSPQIQFPPQQQQQQQQQAIGRERKDSISWTPTSFSSGVIQNRVHVLRQGDTVYWHHLRKGGERSTAVDPLKQRHQIRGSFDER